MVFKSTTYPQRFYAHR